MAIQPSAGGGAQPTEAEIAEMFRKEQLLAHKIHTEVLPALRERSIDERREVFNTHYPNFLKCHPVVCKWMVLYDQFNLVAMRKYMELNRKSPPKSMEDSMRNSAQYVRFLYIETEKAAGRHYDVKHAAKLAAAEERELFSEYNRIKKQEAEARNSFEAEALVHAEERRRDLIKFMATHRPVEPIELTAEERELERRLFGEPEPEVQPEDPIELVLLQYRAAMVRIQELESDLEVKSCILERMEERLLTVAKRMIASDRDDWLRGTSAAPAPAKPAVAAKTGRRKARK